MKINEIKQYLKVMVVKPEYLLAMKCLASRTEIDINEHLSMIGSIKGDCLDRFTADSIYRGALLHYLYLLSDSCIVLAELVIKYKNLRTPQSYSDAIESIKFASV